jgi:hypothetical protein
MTAGAGERGVLDTSIIILLERIGDTSWLPGEPGEAHGEHPALIEQ